MPSDPTVHDTYAEYPEWKGWNADSFGTLSATDRRYYDLELTRTQLALNKPLSVLEVGFGNGQFLAYAKAKGWKVTGTEVNRDLVELATRHDFDAICADTLASLADSSFDLVVAFEVLEHIDQPSILRLLKETKRVLRKNGVFVARFPNGDSPFGLVNQNGDVTHVSVIGSGKVTYFAREMQATVLFVGGKAQPILTGNTKETIYRLFAMPLRKLIDFLVNLIVLPKTPVAFCSTSLVMILRSE